MPHSSRNMHIKVIHTKLDVNFKTKYNHNKRSSDQHLAYILRLTLPKEFMNDNNDSKLTKLT